MSEYEKEFIKRVRKEIAVFHLSQDAVGSLIGMSRQSLSKLLNCKVDSIRADTMLKLARVFSISIDEIVGLEEAKKEAEKIANEFAAYEIERAQLQAEHYNKMAKHIRDLGYHMPDFPGPIEPKTVTWSGVNLEDLKKDCEKADTINVKTGINGEWVSMPVDEFFRMLGDRKMLEGKRWPEH